MTDRNAPKPTREVIGARLRYDVLRRCNFACYYCGVPASLGVKQLHVDHVVPVSLGGKNDPWNLVAACWDCNAGKTNDLPDPATIQAVHDAYMADASRQAGDVYRCQWCKSPFRYDPDVNYTDQCEPCADLRMDVWNMAYGVGYNTACGIASVGGDL